MTCSEVNKQLKQFLEDLLAEEEYLAFFDHLESCPGCKDYVNSFGSLSNQLWESGNVKVPSDFSATVIFKLKQSEQEIGTHQSAVPKKVVIGILIFIIGALSVFFGIGYLKTRKHSQTDQALKVSTQIIRRPLSDREAQPLLQQLETMASGLGAVKKETGGKGSEGTIPAQENASLTDISSKEISPSIPAVKPLHWHVLVSEKSDKTGLGGEKLQKELELKQKLEGKAQLEGDIKLLEEKKQMLEKMHTAGELKKETAAEKEEREASVINMEKEMSLVTGRIEQLREGHKDEEAAREETLYARLQKAYSEEIKKVKEAGKSGIALELEQRLKEREGLESSIRSSEDEIRSIELKAQQMLEEKRRREAARRQKLFDTLNAMGIRADYELAGHIVFTGTGEMVERALEQILSIFQSSSIRDFTGGTATLADREYSVSICLEEGEARLLHWHVGPLRPGQKSSLLDIIRKQSNSIDYKSEELVVFSIPAAKLDELRRQIQVMRVSFSEYDYTKSEEGRLSSGPITMSIYFSR